MLLALSPAASACDTAEACFGEGLRFYEAEEYEKAVASLERAVEFEPGNASFHHWLGRSVGRLAEQSRWLRALTLVRMCICVLAAAALSWYAIRGAYTSTLRQEMSYAVIAFPLWPARIVIATGFVMLTLQYIVDLVREVRDGPHHTVETIPGEGLA